jgi:hypothetical protein
MGKRSNGRPCHTDGGRRRMKQLVFLGICLILMAVVSFAEDMTITIWEYQEAQYENGIILLRYLEDGCISDNDYYFLVENNEIITHFELDEFVYTYEDKQWFTLEQNFGRIEDLNYEFINNLPICKAEK